MMSNADGLGRREIILLTCRRAETDFRYHLARELQALGHHVTYIHVKRVPEATDMATLGKERWSIPRLFRFFGGLRGLRPRAIVFNSTNLAFPGLVTILRRLSRAFWVYDMHDDLLYEIAGVARLRARIAQRIVTHQADLIVHAAPTLGRLFPRSVHLGNASSIPALPKIGEDPNRVLVLASLDKRLDFALLADAARACPRRLFEIHGHVSGGPTIERQVEALVAGAPNISYHGPYTDDDLPQLMQRYLVSFAPYRTGTKLTEFIDPLRFYHCLGTGTGLVSTPIPQAIAMQDHIEVISQASELDAALDRAHARRGGGGRSWREAAERLEEILATHVR